MQSNCKEPNIEQKGNRVVEVTEKKEVSAAKCVRFLIIMKFIGGFYSNFVWKTQSFLEGY